MARKKDEDTADQGGPLPTDPPVRMAPAAAPLDPALVVGRPEPAVPVQVVDQPPASVVNRLAPHETIGSAVDPGKVANSPGESQESPKSGARGRKAELDEDV